MNSIMEKIFGPVIGKYAWGVAGKRVVFAMTGYFIGQALGVVNGEQMAQALAFLSTVGVHITVAIDEAVFRSRMEVAGIAGVTILHDWLRVRFPDSKWL